MEIDNKTKAAVLREFADNLETEGYSETAKLTRVEADKLDPPLYPIHPHAGCDGMKIELVKKNDCTTEIDIYEHGYHKPNKWQIPREASKVPAFLCDGTRPEWVKDGDFVWFYTCMSTAEAWVTDWQRFKGMHFCVINPIEVK